jgi:hypothetical protein
VIVPSGVPAGAADPPDRHHVLRLGVELARLGFGPLAVSTGRTAAPRVLESLRRSSLVRRSW